MQAGRGSRVVTVGHVRRLCQCWIRERVLAGGGWRVPMVVLAAVVVVVHKSLQRLLSSVARGSPSRSGFAGEANGGDARGNM